MSRHTPGPWFGRPHFDPIMVQGASEVGLELAFSCGGGNPKRDEYQANARLIAAAPDLLAALERIQHLNGNDYFDGGVCAMRAIAEAAIARATQPLPPPNEE